MHKHRNHRDEFGRLHRGLLRADAIMGLIMRIFAQRRRHLPWLAAAFLLSGSSAPEFITCSSRTTPTIVSAFS